MSPSDRKATELIAAGRSVAGPSPEQRAAMKRAVIAAVAAAPVVAVGAARARGAAKVTTVKLVVVTLGVVGAAAVSWWVQASESTPPRPTPIVSPMPAARPEPRRDPVVESPAPAPSSAPTQVRPRPPPPRPGPGPVTGSAVSAEKPTLDAEVTALTEAMAEVDAQHHAAALTALAKYKAHFPNGVLASEAGVVEVLALCGLDRVTEAKARATELRETDAANPSLRRLANSCVAP